MGCVFNTVVVGSSGIGEWVIVGWPVLIEVNSVGVGLIDRSKKYVWEVPSGSISSTNCDSVAGGYLLDGEWVER